MAKWLGRCVGAAVCLQVLQLCVACGSDERRDSDGSGGTSGSGGTDPQGQGGTDPQGQGGTDPQGQGGTEPNGQGGSAGEASPGGAGGDPGVAGGAGDAGAGGAPSPCDDGGEAECAPCRGSLVHVECDERCLCEPANHPLKPVYDDLLACDLDEPCPLSLRYDDPGSATWSGGGCLLTAFRDQLVGKYHHTTTVADIGEYTTEYTFLVGQGGRALVLRTTTSGPASGNFERTYFPVWSCGFRSYEALDTCLGAGTNVSPSTTGGGAAICDTTAEWFDDCVVVENPECPGE